jgi:GTP-binding protein
MAPLALRFVMSAPDVSHLPDSDIEVAVVGRSNVGKSSLINALAKRKGLAVVSNTPGRTRLLNMFAVETGGAIIDLPGYGYAQVSKQIRRTWPAMIEGYLLERPQLSMVMSLIDGEIGPTKLDQQMLAWLRENEVPHQVVATKHDKVKSTKRPRRKSDLAAGCGLDPGDVVWVSATTGLGLDQLSSLVRTWLTY